MILDSVWVGRHMGGLIHVYSPVFMCVLCFVLSKPSFCFSLFFKWCWSLSFPFLCIIWYLAEITVLVVFVNILIFFAVTFVYILSGKKVFLLAYLGYVISLSLLLLFICIFNVWCNNMIVSRYQIFAVIANISLWYLILDHNTLDSILRCWDTIIRL